MEQVFLFCFRGKFGTFQQDKAQFLLFLIIQCRGEQGPEDCWMEVWFSPGGEGYVYYKAYYCLRVGVAFGVGNS